MNLQRIVALAWKEWREIVRDRLFFALAFIVPTMLMLLFGFGLTLDVENLPFAVVDHDRTPPAATTPTASSRRATSISRATPTTSAIDRLLADNQVRVALVIPPRFDERLAGASRRRCRCSSTAPSRCAPRPPRATWPPSTPR
jgi:ABC-2 type transport system permease protein/ribosome-dependent ATPase